MAYKSILTVATAADRLEPALSVASRLALAEDGHLDVLALGIDATQVAYYNMGGTAVVLQMALERAETDAQAIEKAANALILTQPAGLRASVEAAVAQLGGMTGLVGLRSRFADLVVLSGGVSVGDYEVVRQVLAERGDAAFRHVHLQPGKPQG